MIQALQTIDGQIFVRRLAFVDLLAEVISRSDYSGRVTVVEDIREGDEGYTICCPADRGPNEVIPFARVLRRYRPLDRADDKVPSRAIYVVDPANTIHFECLYQAAKAVAELYGTAPPTEEQMAAKKSAYEALVREVASFRRNVRKEPAGG